MGVTTHGILKFKSLGVIGEQIKGRKKLTMGLNRLEKQLKSAVKADNVQNDIQISLLRYELTIIGLFNLYIQQVGIFDPRELKRYRLVPQPVFRFIEPAIATASRILKTLDCGVKEVDTMKAIKVEQEEYLSQFEGHKRKPRGKGKGKRGAKK